MSDHRSGNTNTRKTQTRPEGEGSDTAGKVANDHNRPGAPPATQLNQGRRTPESRHDREAQVGSGTVGGGTRGAG